MLDSLVFQAARRVMKYLVLYQSHVYVDPVAQTSCPGSGWTLSDMFSSAAQGED